jgi:hypothetical protein
MERSIAMKVSKIAAAVAMGLALASGQVALAQKPMDNVMKGATNKDNMISKDEAMRMFGEKFDQMAKKGQLTPAEFQKLVNELMSTYAANP